jgi:hypothetical protein
VWNNVELRSLILLLLALTPSASLWAQQPHLLLTARRLHRLKLDVQRQTERWANFEKRVKTVPDSPERGFELALYSRVTDDADSCQKAIQWGLGHVQNIRQNALIVDWCRDSLTGDQQTALLPNLPETGGSPFRNARDRLFAQIAGGNASLNQARTPWNELLPLVQRDPRLDARDLYALYEFLDAVNTNFHTDLRRDDAKLFSDLPAILLLSQQPEQTERPDRQTRLAGLMMVNLDPNLQASSFVQGWAMEDPKMVRQGPGVGYEFLLADPYLPGLGYYNMTPWVYEPSAGFLLARSSWDAVACWIAILRGQFQSAQCPANVRNAAAQFGGMNLLPLLKGCVEIKQSMRTTTILSSLMPGEAIEWRAGNQKRSAQADVSGLLPLPADAWGKICRKR